MDILKKYVKLSSRVALYVPGTIDINHATDTGAWVATIQSAFAEMFGGATASAAAGYWMSEQVNLVSEDVTIVYSYSDTETLKTAIHKVLALAHEMKTALRQEAVSLEVNGSLYFIE